MSPRYTIPLPGADEPVTVEGPFPLQEHEWDHFITVLEAMKPGLVMPSPAGQDVEGSQ